MYTTAVAITDPVSTGRGYSGDTDTAAIAVADPASTGHGYPKADAAAITNPYYHNGAPHPLFYGDTHHDAQCGGKRFLDLGGDRGQG